MGVAGPVGSGKTALVDQLSKRLWPEVNLAVVTNDNGPRPRGPGAIKLSLLVGAASRLHEAGNLVDHRWISQRCHVTEGPILRHVTQQATHDLARACLG